MKPSWVPLLPYYCLLLHSISAQWHLGGHGSKQTALGCAVGWNSPHGRTWHVRMIQWDGSCETSRFGQLFTFVSDIGCHGTQKSEKPSGISKWIYSQDDQDVQWLHVSKQELIWATARPIAMLLPGTPIGALRIGEDLLQQRDLQIRQHHQFPLPDKTASATFNSPNTAAIWDRYIFWQKLDDIQKRTCLWHQPSRNYWPIWLIIISIIIIVIIIIVIIVIVIVIVLIVIVVLIVVIVVVVVIVIVIVLIVIVVLIVVIVVVVTIREERNI